MRSLLPRDPASESVQTVGMDALSPNVRGIDEEAAVVPCY
jgi:hypothetical protein